MFRLAFLALLPALALAASRTWRGNSADRILAVQLATAVATQALAISAFVFDQPSYTDLALALAFLSVPGTLLYALFYERWL